MKKVLLFLAMSAMFSLFYSCSDDDENNDNNEVITPATYSFTRDGGSTVSYGGQTTRIKMAEEFRSVLKDVSKTEAELDGMFAHSKNGQDFSDPELNESSKQVRNKTAASYDFFNSNSTDAASIKADFDLWIAEQVDFVFPNWDNIATAGNPGVVTFGSSSRRVNGKGLEYDQAINKGLIGALMVDQILNNYLSSDVLDAGTNRADNDSGTLYVDDNGVEKDYTLMEHKWDEAFGYLYGTDDATNPQLNADKFLNKYLDRVENDVDFAGIANDIYTAFKRGRAAIVAKNYTVRDEQANIIREKISMIIGIRAVYYLQGGKNALTTTPDDKPTLFHDLSEGYGFIYSLMFTRKPNSNDPYFTKTEVDGFIATLEAGNGFWDITVETLDTMSSTIAAKFDFTVDEAAN